jgi:cyclic pyranopterin phosphate synthase
VRRIIFSGGEVTLSDELCDYARAARKIPGVEHVRIQTNATRLGRRGKVAELVDAGIDEYFVSVHGHDEPLVDGLLQKKGAFRAMVAGLEAIRDAGDSITNTAIVAPNASVLPEIVEFAGFALGRSSSGTTGRAETRRGA